MGFKSMLARLKQGLAKTRNKIASGIKSIVTIGRKIDSDLLDELEEILILADIGPETSMRIIEELKAAYKDKTVNDSSEILAFLKEHLKNNLKKSDSSLRFSPTKPTVIMVVGVNGSGKTTSIAKLAHILTKEMNKSVILAASDTFRAAAAEQLEIWAQRIGVDVVRHTHGSDPAAVAFDACEAALARGKDVLIVDTAGRLHTYENLMRELNKIERVIQKKIPGAPHEVLLVLDATTGQNAIAQAKMFKEVSGVSGIFLAKLDGTAKGGIVVTIQNQIGIPVKFIGIGETSEDIEPFDVDNFVEAFFA